MRILLASTIAVGLLAVAVPANAECPWVCVKYPCCPEDYPPFLIDTVKDLIKPS